MITKICTKCGLEKPLEEFVKRSRNKDGHTSECLECHRKICNTYTEKNRERIRTNRKRNKDRCKSIMNNLKSKGCIICGESDIACIDFHHLKDKISEVGTIFKCGSMQKALKEVEKCVTLCANCHRKLHFYNLTLENLMQQYSASIAA